MSYQPKSPVAIDIAICPHPKRILNKSCFTIIESYINILYCLPSDSSGRVCLISFTTVQYVMLADNLTVQKF